MAKSGRSSVQEKVMGTRRLALDKNEKKMRVLAPRHFRKMGRHYLDDVTDVEIGSFYLGFSKSDFEAMVAEKKDSKIENKKMKWEEEVKDIQSKIKEKMDAKAVAVAADARADLRPFNTTSLSKKIHDNEISIGEASSRLNLFQNIKSEIENYRENK
jgi:hypothetical protein